MKKRTNWVSTYSTSEKREGVSGVSKIHRRLPSKQRRSGELRRRSRKGRRVFIHKDYQHDLLVRWSVAAGVVTLVAVLFIFTHWLKKQRSASASADTASSRQMRLIDNTDSPNSDEAVELVKSAMAITDPESISGYFHLGDSKPEEVISFLEEQEYTHPDTRFFWVGSMTASRLPMEGVSIELQKGGERSIHMALLHPGLSNRWKIDFPALARICSPSWEEIENNQPETARVRVIAGLDNYFNGPFNDKEWFSFRLNSPDLDRWYYAYCRADSVQAKAMRRILTLDTSAGAQGNLPGRRIVLDLKKVADAQDNQFEIERVVAEDWVIQDELFDENITVD